MDCEKFLALLDAYVDNELSEAEKVQFLMHAETCDTCKMELQNAEMLRSFLNELDDDVVVPLQAQAAWRRAVREEAKKQTVRSNKRMWTRIAYAAAALVLLVGCTFALNDDLFAKGPSAIQLASVENDGAAEMTAANGPVAAAKSRSVDMGTFGKLPENYTAYRYIGVSDYTLACKTVEDLALEYNGTSEKEELGGEASYVISMPQAYMPEFLNAASRIGTELEAETLESDDETAIICIRICTAA